MQLFGRRQSSPSDSLQGVESLCNGTGATTVGWRLVPTRISGIVFFLENLMKFSDFSDFLRLGPGGDPQTYRSVRGDQNTFLTLPTCAHNRLRRRPPCPPSRPKPLRFQEIPPQTAKWPYDENPWILVDFRDSVSFVVSGATLSTFAADSSDRTPRN